MTTKSAAQRLAEFAVSVRDSEIPSDVLEAATLHLLDTVGCALAAQGIGAAGQGRDLVAEQGGAQQATAIGVDHRLPAASCAFANAMLAHALDFDDTHSDSMVHVTAVVGPAALAAAEAREATGRELLSAIVIGSEIATRIGMAVTGRFHERGFHATEVCGVFGGAAAVLRLSAVSPATATSGLGIAGSLAGGLFAYLEDGTATKPVHPAWAAHGSVMAAELAKRGAEGPAHVIEGRFGLYHAFIDAEPGSVDLSGQLADLGERWETPRIAYKPYPVCHFIHGSLGATASLLDAITRGEVAGIEVSVPPAAVPIVLEPVASKVAPRTDYERKFSLQYCTAAMVRTGKVDVSTFADGSRDEPAVEALADKVSYVVRDYATWPAAFPGGVRVQMRDGRVLEADQPHQLGAPDNPMTRDQVIAKFRSNAALALDDADVARLETSLLELQEQNGLSAVVEPLRRARVRAASMGEQLSPKNA